MKCKSRHIVYGLLDGVERREHTHTTIEYKKQNEAEKKRDGAVE